jgi:hypothetical protein
MKGEEKFYSVANERCNACGYLLALLAEGTICLCCCLYALLAFCFLVSSRVCTHPATLAVLCILPFIASIVVDALCYIVNLSTDDDQPLGPCGPGASMRIA